LLGTASAKSLARIGQRWLEVERAMGIENTAVDPILFLNQCFTIFAERSVRLLCEKLRHTSQHQRMRLR
jgi:hypothetical protein